MRFCETSGRHFFFSSGHIYRTISYDLVSTNQMASRKQRVDSPINGEFSINRYLIETSIETHQFRLQMYQLIDSSFID